jgi:hypothetical protein
MDPYGLERFIRVSQMVWNSEHLELFYITLYIYITVDDIVEIRIKQFSAVLNVPLAEAGSSQFKSLKPATQSWQQELALDSLRCSPIHRKRCVRALIVMYSQLGSQQGKCLKMPRCLASIVAFMGSEHLC